jgi:hypothetical protein
VTASPCLGPPAANSLSRLGLPSLFRPAAKATFAAVRNTYLYLTPDLWADFGKPKNPYQEHSEHLAAKKKHHHH